LPYLSRHQHQRIAALAQRLGGVLDSLDTLPRRGPAPPALRGELRRIINALPALAPDLALTHEHHLARSHNPQMADVFVAALDTLAAFNTLAPQLKSSRIETYPRRLQQV
jgi:hypothetical protein